MIELDERAHIAVLTPMLIATIGNLASIGEDRVFEYGKVPGADGNDGKLPRVFVIPSLERRFAQPNKANMTTRSAWRLSVRYVGFTVNEARWAGYQIARALNQQQITVGGLTSTALTHERTEAVAPDAGRYSGLVFYRYAL